MSYHDLGLDIPWWEFLGNDWIRVLHEACRGNIGAPQSTSSQSAPTCMVTTKGKTRYLAIAAAPRITEIVDIASQQCSPLAVPVRMRLKLAARIKPANRYLLYETEDILHRTLESWFIDSMVPSRQMANNCVIVSVLKFPLISHLSYHQAGCCK